MGISRARIVDRFTSTLWGKSAKFRDHFARRLVLPVVFSLILILVDAIIFWGSKSDNTDISVNLPLLLGLHLLYVIGMLVWVLQSISRLDHIRNHIALQESHRKELLDLPELNAIVAKLFKYILLCVPIVGGAFYYKRSPGDGYEQIVEKWFNHKQFSAAVSGFEVQACDRCLAMRPESSKRWTNPFRWINHGSFIDRSQIICRGIFVKERKIAIICLYFDGSHDLSSIQSDYLDGLIAGSAPAIEWARVRESSGPADESGELERIQIARYLHDTLVNDLSFLNFKMDQIQGGIAAKDYSGLQTELSILGIIAKRSYKLVRDILHRLSVSQPADLVFGLTKYADEVSSRANLDIDFVMQGKPRTLLPDVNRNILYIVREALRNAEKHAKADHIDVVMVWEFESLRINISDNGIGFAPDAVQQEKKHFGLEIVHECAKEINADVKINSVLNGGTQLTLTLPL